MGKDPVTAASASVRPKNGGFLESIASVTTGTAINMTALSAQGMGCAIVGPVSVGTAGRATPAKSGWEPITERERGSRTLGRETKRPGSTQSRPSCGSLEDSLWIQVCMSITAFITLLYWLQMVRVLEVKGTIFLTKVLQFKHFCF